ncbi:MAG: tetratricopeptide repeat protein [Betaproteobacteria bacterium]
MSDLFRHGTLLIVVGATLCCGSGIAGVTEGNDAFVKGDYVTALKELRPLAERGNAKAQYRLGRMYEFGQGVAVDKAQALVWLRRSAAQGDSEAQLELGVIYATGDGVKQDDKMAVALFQKAATQGEATAQYNLGLMYAKGNGVQKDYPQAVAWFRKAAEQGDVRAQFKMGVVYANGEGVGQDDVLAFANYAIAARDGNAEALAQRDGIGKRLKPARMRQAQALAADWQVGKPMPGSPATAASKDQAIVAAPPPAPARPNKCSATGTMEGEKFTASNCAVSLYGDQHSVAIWFNEDPISPPEAESFQISSYADGAQGGKQRTLVQIMFCPGGGATTASPSAVKSIDLNTNHAKSPLAGIQWVVESPKDFKVEKMTGEVKPGAMLTGRIVGNRSKTSWNLEFDVRLPQKDAAAGMACSK